MDKIQAHLDTNLSEGTRIRTDSEGYPLVSRLQSYIYWKNREVDIPLSPVCPLCEGYMFYKSEQGPVRCICWMKQDEEHLIQVARLVGSSFTPRRLEDFQIWGTAESQESLARAGSIVGKWLSKIDKWLYMVGRPGCGKTFLLEVIAYRLFPWAIYVTASDFEDQCYQRLSDNSLNEYLEYLKYVPILLFDDLGTGYNKDYPVSKLRSVITHRYSVPEEFPTVVTTNLSMDSLYMFDPRIADRILDRDHARIIEFLNVASWRTG